MRLQVEINDKLLEQLDKRCEGYGLDRASFVRMLIKVGRVSDTQVEKKDDVVVPIVSPSNGLMFSEKMRRATLYWYGMNDIDPLDTMVVPPQGEIRANLEKWSALYSD